MTRKLPDLKTTENDGKSFCFLLWLNLKQLTQEENAIELLKEILQEPVKDIQLIWMSFCIHTLLFVVCFVF